MLFYLCGLLQWGYFSQNFQSTSTTLSNNAGLFGKVYFPRLIVPLSGIFSNIVPFFIQLATFAAFFVWFKFSSSELTFGLDSTAWLLPLITLQVAAISLGVGLWVAALTTKFRDFSILATFIIQLWLYATPVIYPLARIPERWRLWVALNPMTMPIECTRKMLLGEGQPTFNLIGISVGVTLATLVSGLLIFQRVEKTFVDVI